MATKRKQCAYTPAKKLQILDELDKKLLTRKEILEKHGLPSSTLSTWVKYRAEIEEAHVKTSGTRKRFRQTSREDMESALYDWFKSARAMNLPVSGPILMEKAVALSQEMGVEFVPSNGWLQRFRDRRGIAYKTISGECASVPMAEVEEWRTNTLPKLLEEYAPRDVYNADETGLFYKCLSSRTLTMKGERCSGGKKSKERITILLGANMDGSDKLPLLAIGKSAKPRCFKNTKKLPVDYHANKRSWMNSTVFEQWVKKLDRRFQLEDRKVLLLVDNSPTHPKISLRNVRLEFLPPNTTSMLQPCDQGIIANFKHWYRQMIMQKIVVAMGTITEPVNDACDVIKMSLLDALVASRKAWDMVTETTVANCFKHAGFIRPQPEGQVAEEPELEPVKDDSNLEATLRQLKALGVPIEVTAAEMVSVDADLHTTALPTLGAGPSQESDDESEEEEEEEAPPAPTNAEARAAADLLVRYLMSRPETTDAELTHILETNQVVDRVGRRSAKQTTLDMFFRKQ